jgi:two-component system aerobic respiration control sensor histidine kinase ArcB
MDDGHRTETTGEGAGDALRFNETLQRFGHDMRSAVSDVVGGLRLVDIERLDPETRTQIERVAAAGDALASLVESALLMASGAGDVANEGVRLSGLLELWRKRWTGHASEAGVALSLRRRCRSEPDLPRTAHRDRPDRVEPPGQCA